MTTYDGYEVISVVKGEPTTEELAALLTVLRSRAAARRARSVPGGTPRGWSDRVRLMRRYPGAGTGAWRASAWVDR